MRLFSRVSRSRCHQTVVALQAYLDGEVDARTATAVAEHLEVCRLCGLDASTYRAIKAALAAGAGTAVDPAAVDRLHAFAERLGDEGPAPSEG